MYELNHLDYKPHLSPFQPKQKQFEQGDRNQRIKIEKGTKKGGEYNLQIAIISSTAYKELNKRYSQLKEEQQRQKEQRLKVTKQ